MIRNVLPLLLLLAISSGCRAGGESSAEGARSRSLEILARDGEVIVRIKAEIVSSPDATSRGLMYRDDVPEGTGMLFVFPKQEVRSFWMKNTRVSLDIIFIDDAGEVVGIRRNTEPFSEASITVGVPSKYVLEVPAGYCSELGIHRGARVVLPF